MLTTRSTPEEIRDFFDANPSATLKEICSQTQRSADDVFFILTCED
jgi:hypothetical protein